MKLGKKKTAVEVISGGLLLGAGVKRLAVSLGIMNGVLSGYGQVPVIGNRRMNGYGKVPVIGNNGYSPSTSLNGYQVPRSPSIMGSAYGNGSGSDLIG